MGHLPACGSTAGAAALIGALIAADALSALARLERHQYRSIGLPSGC